MKKLIVFVIATAAISMLAVVSNAFAATTCVWWSYQPEMPQKEVK